MALEPVAAPPECRDRVGVPDESGRDELSLLLLAASLERGSEHPLAAAIVKSAEERGVVLVEAEDFQGITGKGVR